MPAEAPGAGDAGAAAGHVAIDPAQLKQQPPKPMAEPATTTTPYTALAAEAEPPAAPEKPAANAGSRSAGPTQPVVHDPLLKDLDPKTDLPTPLQLWRFIFNDLLFGNPNCRDLVWANLLVHLTVWTTFGVLLWGFFMKWLPFTWYNKLAYVSSLIIFSSASDTIGLLLSAGILIRLRDNARAPGIIEIFRRLLRFRRVTTLMYLAASSTFVRLIYVTANNLIPLCGVFCIPAMIRQCSLRRKGVAWVEQFDMTVPLIIGLKLGYPSARYAAIDYYLLRWGRDPWPVVRTDSVLIPVFMSMLFFVILPLVFVGQHLRDQRLIAGGLTASIATICFLQFTRPLTSSIYCYAAFLYTEHRRNDIFGSRWPKLMPNAFRSLAKEKEAKKRVNAALGTENKEGWVILDTGKVAEAAVAEGEVDKEVAEMEQREQGAWLEEGKLSSRSGERTVGED